MFEITVKETRVEEAEIGHEWEKTGKKEPDGSDAWAYTPSQRGQKEVTRTVFTRIATAVDLDGLGRLISRSEKLAGAAIGGKP